MKSLVQALVETAAFIELSPNEVIDPDAAVQALESIVASLAEASEEEKQALLAYCREQAAAIPVGSPPREDDRRVFYLKFAEAYGLSEE